MAGANEVLLLSRWGIWGMVIVLEVSTRRFDLGHLSSEITCLVTDDGCEVLNSLPHTVTHIP